VNFKQQKLFIVFTYAIKLTVNWSASSSRARKTTSASV